MNNPLVSIVIPVYNVQSCVNDCLKSIEQQDYNNFEVIIVDDSSTDDSYNVCSEYLNLIQDSRFKLFIKKNGGLSDARNFGLKHCSDSSQYIVFIDSDDEITPNCISTLLQYADEKTLVIGTLLRCIKRSKPTISPSSDCCYYDNLWDNEKFLRHIPSGILNSSCAKCYSLKIIRQHNLIFKKTFPEDTLFNISYVDKIERICYIGSPIYYYFIWPQSLSTKPVEVLYTNYMRIQRMLYQRISAEFHKYVDLLVYSQYRNNTMRYIKIKDFKTPNKYLSNELIQHSMKAYRPVSFADRLLHTLLKHRLLKLIKLLY